MEKVFEVVFKFKLKAHSKKAKHKAHYKEKLVSAISNATPSFYAEVIDENLDQSQLYHGIMYYVPPSSKIGVGDADNLAKFVWDALESIAYEDDSILKVRTAGIIDRNQLAFEENPTINPDIAQRIYNAVSEDKGTVLISINKVFASQLKI